MLFACVGVHKNARTHAANLLFAGPEPKEKKKTKEA